MYVPYSWLGNSKDKAMKTNNATLHFFMLLFMFWAPLGSSYGFSLTVVL